MRMAASLRALCGLLVIAGVAGWVGSGCSGTSRKGPESADPSRAEAAKSSGPTGSGSPGEPADLPRWTRVKVASANLEPGAGKHLLVVKALPPAGGWKLEIRPVPASSPADREFEVVGLAPAGPARLGATPEVVRCVVDLDEKVEQVIVHDDDDARVIPSP